MLFSVTRVRLFVRDALAGVFNQACPLWNGRERKNTAAVDR